MSTYEPPGSRSGAEPPLGGPPLGGPTPGGPPLGGPPLGGPTYSPPSDQPAGGFPTAGWGAPPTQSGPASPVLVAQAVGAAVLGAVVWALLLDFANLQLSLIAAVTGSLVGSLLARALGRGVPAAVVAGLLTAGSALAGEVLGTWLHIARQENLSFGFVRSRIPVQDILQNLGALAWLFVLAGVVLAVLAGIGRYDRFGANRRPGGFAGRF